MTPEQQAARERGLAAIARAEATLAAPRLDGSTWEGKPEATVIVRKAVARPAPLPQRAATYVTDAQLSAIVSGIAKTTGAAIRERDGRISDLETRLTALEALIAKAKGSTQ